MVASASICTDPIPTLQHVPSGKSGCPHVLICSSFELNQFTYRLSAAPSSGRADCSGRWRSAGGRRGGRSHVQRLQGEVAGGSLLCGSLPSGDKTVTLQALTEVLVLPSLLKELGSPLLASSFIVEVASAELLQKHRYVGKP
jgi:hypothetical protein